MKNVMTCCFIDYNLFENNENQTTYKQKLKEKIESLIKDYYVIHFISGVSRGFEQLAAENIIELKNVYPKITLEAVLPYENFPVDWSKEERDKYYFIMEKIDKETLLQYHYTKDCIRKKNVYIINKSNFIIVLCKNTCEINDLISYAKSKKKTLFIIESDT